MSVTPEPIGELSCEWPYVAKLAESSMKMVRFRLQLDPGEVTSTKSRLSGQVAAVTFAHEQLKAACGHARRCEKPLSKGRDYFLVGRHPRGRRATKLPTRNGVMRRLAMHSR